MIVSASRRSDIPAFYYPWLLNRLLAGEAWVPNPFNPRQITVVPLSPRTVDALVLWSKNPAPMLERPLPPYPWYMQYTLNDYPAAFEPGLPAADQRVETFRALAALGGPEALVWRYDPIIFAGDMDAAWHCQRFERLCRRLQGATNQAVISFLDSYSKIAGWLRRSGIRWPELPERQALAARLAQTGADYGITVTACCEAGLNLPSAHCIDAARLSRIAGPLSLPPDRGQRPGCGCAASVDIGRYDSCPHGCGYCYANASAALARSHFSQHNPEAPMMWGEPHPEAKFKILENSSARSLL